MLQIVVVAVFLLVPVSAQQFRGNCDYHNVTTVENFNTTKYLGKWYEVQRYESFYQKGNDCTEVFYYQSVKYAEIFATTQERNIKTNASYIFNGTIRAATNISAKFVYISSNITMDYWIVNTDYVNYSIVWSCIPGEPTSQTVSIQYLWVLSRTPELTSNASSIVNATLLKHAFNTSAIRRTVQDPKLCYRTNAGNLITLTIFGYIFAITTKIL